MRLTHSRLAFEYLSRALQADVEEFWALALRPDKSVIKRKLLFRGTVDSCMVHPRDLFRFACQENASSLIIAHNHPSQDPTPSKEDIELTHSLLQASYLMQIPIIDHIVISDDQYASMADLGLLEIF